MIPYLHRFVDLKALEVKKNELVARELDFETRWLSKYCKYFWSKAATKILTEQRYTSEVLVPINEFLKDWCSEMLEIIVLRFTLVGDFFCYAWRAVLLKTCIVVGKIGIPQLQKKRGVLGKIALSNTWIFSL